MSDGKVRKGVIIYIDLTQKPFLPKREGKAGWFVILLQIPSRQILDIWGRAEDNIQLLPSYPEISHHLSHYFSNFPSL